jgi:predicted transcriptional regulator
MLFYKKNVQVIEMFTPTFEENVPRRDLEQILYKIISVSQKGIKQTQIMYQCNISFSQLKNYLGKSIKYNYITSEEGKKNTVYEATKKGGLFLTIFDFLNQLYSTGKNETNRENKDPYVDGKLKSQVQATLSSLTSMNHYIESLEFKKIDVLGSAHRSQYSITEEVLNLANNGTIKSNFMYKCNLSFKQLKKYLAIFMQNDLIETKTDKENTSFQTTDKGKIFAQSHGLIRYLMETGLDNDPFNDELIEKVKTALKPALVIDVPQEAYLITPKQLLTVKK